MRVINKKKLKLLIRSLLIVSFFGYGAVFINSHLDDIREQYKNVDYEEAFQKEYGISYDQWVVVNYGACRKQAIDEAKKITGKATDQWNSAWDESFSIYMDSCLKPAPSVFSSRSFERFFIEKILSTHKQYVFSYLSLFLGGILFLPFLLVDIVPRSFKSFYNWITKQN